MSIILNRKELMQLLGYKDKDAFRAKLRHLINNEDFPPNLPGLPNKWSKLQIDAWIAGIRPKREFAHQTSNITSLQARAMGRKFAILNGGLDQKSNIDFNQYPNRN
jgi:predicted DNA-binding transcriptional regulator AlpA